MTEAWALLALPLLSLTTVVHAQNAGASQLPELEVTQQKTRALSEGLANIQRLTQQLEDLGSPGKPTEGESNSAYLKRVDRTFKGRALLVSLVHQELEQALDAKNKLRLQLEDYQRWADRVARELKLEVGKIREDVSAIERDASEEKRNGIVLASMLFQQLSASIDPTLKEEAEGLREYFIDRDKITDRSAREKSLGSKFTTADSQRAELQRIIDSLKDKDWDIKFSRNSVLPEIEQLAVALPMAHQEAIRSARVFLEMNGDRLKELEAQAVQISIVARHVHRTLAFVQPSDAVDRVVKELATFTTSSEPLITDALKAFVSGKIPTAAQGNLFRLETSPTSGSNDAAPVNVDKTKRSP